MGEDGPEGGGGHRTCAQDLKREKERVEKKEETADGRVARRHDGEITASECGVALVSVRGAGECVVMLVGRPHRGSNAGEYRLDEINHVEIEKKEGYGKN